MKNIGGIPESLGNLLSDKKITKIGQGVNDGDNEKLEIDNVKLDGVIDLQKIAQNFGFQKLGLKNITERVLGKYLDKSPSVSNWEKFPLTSKQIIYAATDAWITLFLYNKLSNFVNSTMVTIIIIIIIIK